MFIGSDGAGPYGMMSGMGVGMLVIVLIIFAAGLAVGYLMGSRR